MTADEGVEPSPRPEMSREEFQAALNDAAADARATGLWSRQLRDYQQREWLRSLLPRRR